MFKVEVSYTPETYSVYENTESIVVVTDVLRATSAICTALGNGAKSVIPVSTVDEAKAFQEKGYLVGAERNGEKIEGFDFGNSPYSYMSSDIKGKSIVLTTTNGTKAINLAKESHQVVIGAFTNLNAVATYLQEQGRDVLILCSGWKGRYNLEDTLFAGALTEALNHRSVLNEIEDSALSAMYLYNLAKGDPYKFLMNSSHRRRLKKLNLKEDVRYCLQLDKVSIVPMLKGDEIVVL